MTTEFESGHDEPINLQNNQYFSKNKFLVYIRKTVHELDLGRAKSVESGLAGETSICFMRFLPTSLRLQASSQ